MTHRITHHARLIALLLFFTFSPFHLFTSSSAFAQKRQMAEAENYLRSGSNFDKAEQLMTKLLQDSINQLNSRIHNLLLQAVEKQYQELNERMYKHQDIDTLKLFTLNRRIFTIAERLDSVDALPDKKGRVDPDYRKDNSLRLLGYRPNLFFGGAYHLRKGDFLTAYDFFETYIDCDRQPLFKDQRLMERDVRMGEAAYWATYCGYRLNDPVLTLRHSELARRDTSKLDYTLQFVAEAWNRLGDKQRYAEILWEGFAFFILPRATMSRRSPSWMRLSKQTPSANSISSPSPRCSLILGAMPSALTSATVSSPSTTGWPTPTTMQAPPV